MEHETDWKAKYKAAMTIVEDQRKELADLWAHHRRVVDHWVDLYTMERERADRNEAPF